MNYAQLLSLSIQKADLSLAQICRRLEKKGFYLDRGTLSKMKNGKLPPAKDDLNILLAEVLDIDPKDLRIAAAKETIPKPLYKLIREVG
ncbi:XRE family transcriptional regulator [Paenibacillus polysaccharolyticus]|uniref:XRE family transcriptional regulator n=1 Tax=Paenibacillus polysaccharolyticus TaxID=582692 RepID=UPI00203B8D53|nr:XRE family transcriptional regulator [Paenibacillus polysaccharolyticus]MCM3131839.1 XRE family transcriptional regulator [Paenibacillus polysaccharolyticus]